MAHLDLKRFLKIMGMTTSAADGEALNAMRLANQMLADAKMSWEDLLVKGSEEASSAKAQASTTNSNQAAAPNKPAQAPRNGGFSYSWTDAYDTGPNMHRFRLFEKMSSGELWQRLRAMPLPSDQKQKLESLASAVQADSLSTADAAWLKNVFRAREFMM